MVHTAQRKTKKRDTLTLLGVIEGGVNAKCSSAYLICHHCYRRAWVKLGDMSKEDAQKELVQLLYKAAPQLEMCLSSGRLFNK